MPEFKYIQVIIYGAVKKDKNNGVKFTYSTYAFT